MSDRARAPAMTPSSVHGGDPTQRLRALLSLPDVPGATAQLLEAIDDVSLDVARAALRRLVLVAGHAEVTALRERMLTLDTGIVADVAHALDALHDAGATAVAVAALEEASPFKRHKAAIALRELRDPTARAPLVRALDAPEAPVRRVALEALARLPSEPETVRACTQRLKDGDPYVRAAAVAAIAALDGDASVTLRYVLADPHPGVRRAGAGAVDVLDDDGVRVLAGDLDPDVRVAVFEALASRRMVAYGAVGPEAARVLAEHVDRLAGLMNVLIDELQEGER